MKNVLRFYQNILYIIFSHYSKHTCHKITKIFAPFMQKSKVLRYEINTSTLSTFIYALKISEGIEWADE